MRTNAKKVKACGFCRFWQGTPAQPSSPMNYYEYDPNEFAKCMQKQLKVKAGSSGCQKYIFDTYKYPID